MAARRLAGPAPLASGVYRAPSLLVSQRNRDAADRSAGSRRATMPFTTTAGGMLTSQAPAQSAQVKVRRAQHRRAAPCSQHLAAYLAMACVALLVGCREKSEHEPIALVGEGLEVPAPDTSDHCYELAGAPAGLRACYSPTAPHEPELVSRTLPAFDASTKLGWRCVGSRAERRCYDRALAVGNFECTRGRCVQEHPRLPDANEWFCSDAHGAQLCLMQARAAGVSVGRPTPGFVCGERKIRGKNTKEQLCLDLSPDFPDSDAGSWSCHYEADPMPQRICVRKATRNIGSKCGKSGDCPLGSSCKTGHCVPQLPNPSCWLNSDCGNRPCSMGACQ